MNDDGPFITSGSIADAATVSVTFQHFLPQTAEVFFILPLERVADSTHALCEDLRLPTPGNASRAVLVSSSHHAPNILKNDNIYQLSVNGGDSALIVRTVNVSAESTSQETSLKWSPPIASPSSSLPSGVLHRTRIAHFLHVLVDSRVCDFRTHVPAALSVLQL